MSELPQRLTQSSYPDLSVLLDDVVVTCFWVQRHAMRWLPGTPDAEDAELGWLEMYLGELEQATRVARAKVEWRRKLAEVARERRDDTVAREAQKMKETACQSPQEPSASSDAPSASARTG